MAVATALVLVLGFAAVAETVTAAEQPSGPPRDAVAIEAAMAARALENAEKAASRSAQRGASKAEVQAKAQAVKKAQAKAQAAKKALAKKAPAKKPPAKKVVRPVAGLDQRQMNNAAAIVRATKKMKLPTRAAVIAVACAMQESQLYNLASDVLPESKRYAHQGSGSDHDSVGLFQQRSSSGWGPIRELMTPEVSATKFLSALTQVPGWQSMALTYAAQAVQVSAFPEAYAKHEWRATAVVRALA